MENFNVVIVDEKVNARLVADALHFWDFKVKITSFGKECLSWLKTNDINLTLIGIDLPDITGIDLLQYIRTFSDVPILIMGPSLDTVAKRKSFELGANGYLGKPIDTIELLIQCREIRRKIFQEEHISIAFFSWDDISVDFRTLDVIVSGSKVPFSPIEFSLLREFIHNNGTVLTYDNIIDKVWANEYNIGREVVHTYIRRLRAKIEADIHNPRYIISKPRVGYLLNVTPKKQITLSIK
jgi:DNA-binding response OmpR family regulator